ncbi:hypothetical protein FCU45_08715 [Sulfurimonas crateris]|uniref:Histidine Kinase domain-containing protein n=1 Tax=Sulfurimonas crateris TaxID=2574727 RepID=A0A4U2Z6D1_9BACT|nr:ankyrin repeat domain-containing protein [Sulfurimonas crateris]TKI69032.1 hypothetical protein FCU45_08715 [Sulfurimonas crateris]
MENLNIEQILEEQNILELKKIIDQNIDMSEIKLVTYLAEIFNQKKEINIEFLKLLLQTNINKKSPTKKGFLPAHLATLFGDAKVTKVFINNGFDMNEKVEFIIYDDLCLDPKKDKLRINLEESETKRTPKSEDKKYISSFGTAFENYNSENITLLIENGVDIEESIYSLDSILKQEGGFFKSSTLRKVINNNDTKLLNIMIKKGANKFNTSDLAVACENLNFEMIKLLVENGAEVNFINEGDSILEEIPFDIEDNPLSVVCQNSTVEPSGKCASNLDILGSEVLNIIEYLIESGADVNIDSPLMVACSLDYSKISMPFKDNKLENKHYADVNLDIIKLLIEKGANVNHTNYDGTSILMEAMNRMNGFELVRILIENGADVNHKNKQGNSAIALLKDEWFHKESYQEDNDGKWEIEKFNESNGEKILKLLVDNGADINAKNNIGMTPLMHYALKGQDRLVKILLENGADINAKSEMTAYELAGNDEIKNLIKDTKNNNPQKLVKLLSNFTIDKPIKYTTHAWDFGELKKEYGDFDGYMSAVKKQFDGMKNELEELSPNLYKKIYAFLLETNPEENYNWCSKTHINIGWSSLDGLKEWCNNGNKPDNFVLTKPISYEVDFETIKLTKFKDIINLFKQEIEVRDNFKNLENLFANQVDNLGEIFNLDLSAAQLNRQFYTDVEKFSNVLNNIFNDISTRKEYPNIEVKTTELDDRSIEIKITQIDSCSSYKAKGLYDRANIAGDISEIKKALTNLCDWSIESSCEGENFRVNFLHSNNVKDIEPLEIKPVGFTHILRFYK